MDYQHRPTWPIDARRRSDCCAPSHMKPAKHKRRSRPGLSLHPSLAPATTNAKADSASTPEAAPTRATATTSDGPVSVRMADLVLAGRDLRAGLADGVRLPSQGGDAWSLTAERPAAPTPARHSRPSFPAPTSASTGAPMAAIRPVCAWSSSEPRRPDLDALAAGRARASTARTAQMLSPRPRRSGRWFTAPPRHLAPGPADLRAGWPRDGRDQRPDADLPGQPAPQRRRHEPGRRRRPCRGEASLPTFSLPRRR